MSMRIAVMTCGGRRLALPAARLVRALATTMDISIVEYTQLDEHGEVIHAAPILFIEVPAPIALKVCAKICAKPRDSVVFAIVEDPRLEARALRTGVDDVIVASGDPETAAARVAARIRVGASALVVGRPIRPPPTALQMRIIAYLELHPGRVVTRTELWNAAYPSQRWNDASKNRLNVAMFRLRRRAGAEWAERVEPISGVGWRLASGARPAPAGPLSSKDSATGQRTANNEQLVRRRINRRS